MSSANMQTCLGNVGNVVPTCCLILSSGPCQTTWHVMSGWCQPTCRLILFDIKKKCGRLRPNTIPTTHRPLLCQPNHDKVFAASGSMAFCLVVSGLAASGLLASSLTLFGFACYGWLLRVQCWLVWWCGASKLLVASDFAAASFWVSCIGFGEAGFEALGSVGSVWQLPDSGGISHTVRTLEPTGVAKTAEPSAAKPDAGKVVGLSMPFLADATINQLLELINTLRFS